MKLRGHLDLAAYDKRDMRIEPRAHLQIRRRTCTSEGDQLHVDLLLCGCGLEHGKNWVKTVLWDKSAFLAKNSLAGALLPADRAQSFKSPCI